MIWRRNFASEVAIFPSSTSTSRTLDTRTIRLLAALRDASVCNVSSMNALRAAPDVPGGGDATNVTISGWSLTLITAPQSRQRTCEGDAIKSSVAADGTAGMLACQRADSSELYTLMAPQLVPRRHSESRSGTNMRSAAEHCGRSSKSGHAPVEN